MPMKTAGLLNAEQLRTIFSNLEQLITITDCFSEQLQDALDLANEQGDEVHRHFSLSIYNSFFLSLCPMGL